MTHGSLFSGIGGFDLASEWMGWENKFHCEMNPFGQRVLKYYWPDAELFEDITKTDFTKYHGTIDIISGGFPCQPYSVAGQRLGKEDERHLWPQMLRAIREIQPRWVVGENVSGLISWNGGMVFDEVQTDLEAAGYEVIPFILPACAVNAPHRRDRVWFIAYATIERLERCVWWASKGYRPSLINEYQEGVLFEPPVCSGNDGVSPELAGITFSKHRNESIKGYGNAVVPQVVHQIFKAIELYENQILTLTKTKERKEAQ